jgi:hypothetical protein
MLATVGCSRQTVDITLTLARERPVFLMFFRCRVAAESVLITEFLVLRYSDCVPSEALS